MKITEFILGKKVVLHSPLSPEEVKDRINAAAGSMFWPFHSDKVVGGSLLGFMRLNYQSSIFVYSGEPVLSGKLSDNLRQTEINARFGAPLLFKIFIATFYLIIIFFAFIIYLGAERSRDGTIPQFWLIISVFSFIPIFFHFMWTRNSNEDLERILEFLEEEADARPA